MSWIADIIINSFVQTSNYKNTDICPENLKTHSFKYLKTDRSTRMNGSLLLIRKYKCCFCGSYIGLYFYQKTAGVSFYKEVSGPIKIKHMDYHYVICEEALMERAIG